ncbi:NHL repeat-containing protein [Candidatus Venteria ishoeyi]|uniref:NHL repeat-containing protein n=1 Tax=Candidatus Venteria ishoeyi TaxID=1899563 RepID=UPI0025A655D0|nr:NHL repeat-containing protein [Candidatus Venteria ishoeyi]MDM8545575.1 NHL repeat-containing protein [Candidatus Venteria ishoeyi]
MQLFKYFLFCLAFVSGSSLATQLDYQIRTWAGDGNAAFAGEQEAAVYASLNMPTGIAASVDGSVYIADRSNHRVRKISPQGIISTFAGTGRPGFSGDGGDARQAQLKTPGGIAVDDNGTLYIADTGNHVIRKITPQGMIDTVAGSGKAGERGDKGAASRAQLRSPEDVAVDGQGNLYIADRGNHRIRKVNNAGIITSLAGTTAGFSGDGDNAQAARLKYPWGLAVDTQGFVYVADAGNHRIRRISPEGMIETIAGSSAGYEGDGLPATQAKLNHPQGVSIDLQGNVFIADSYNQRIRQINHDGRIFTIAGSSFTGLSNGTFSGDNELATRARLFYPQDISVDASGTLYIADANNHRVRQLKPNLKTYPRMQTIAGSGRTGSKGGGFSGDNAPAAQARFKVPSHLVFDRQGNLYITDASNHRIRKITPAGVVSTVVGNGQAGALDGDPLQASLNQPTGLAIDDKGNLYIGDTGNHKIRKLDVDGELSTLAGTGKRGNKGDDRAAIQARLNQPRGLHVALDGTVYFADSGNHQIRMITPEGILRRVAGTGRTGFRGDGGNARAAWLNQPSDVISDEQGNLYIADRKNQRVRTVDGQGRIYTLAGSGRKGPTDDGLPASKTRLLEPWGLILDAEGALYIAEYKADRVRKLGLGGDLATVAGAGAPGFGGDGGTATAAQLQGPRGMAFGPDGHLYIADSYNHRIRQVNLDVKPTQVVTIPPQEPPAPEADTKETETSENTEVSTELTDNKDEAATGTTETTDSLLPTMPGKIHCTGLQRPDSLNLLTEFENQSVLKQIHALPAFSSGSLTLRQTPEYGYLLLEQGVLRLSVQPLSITKREADDGLNPGLLINAQQETRIVLDKLVIDAQPAMQGLCKLQAAFASLALPKLSVDPQGQIQVRPAIAGADWFSLRPDWIATAIEQVAVQPGLLFSHTLLENGYPTFSFVFIDPEGQKRQQFFHPAPADAAALQQAVKNLSFEAFGPMRFEWQNKSYQGFLHYQVRVGKKTHDAKLQVRDMPDLNGDGKKDFMLVYPEGSQQWLFAQ